MRSKSENPMKKLYGFFRAHRVKRKKQNKKRVKINSKHHKTKEKNGKNKNHFSLPSRVMGFFLCYLAKYIS
jgi:hypothetical protein